jgi:hypothetical protein
MIFCCDWGKNWRNFSIFGERDKNSEGLGEQKKRAGLEEREKNGKRLCANNFSTHESLFMVALELFR